MCGSKMVVVGRKIPQIWNDSGKRDIQALKIKIQILENQDKTNLLLR
jgi:hypothetical protein